MIKPDEAPLSRRSSSWNEGGFTLVEISIVLVIIGLIISGIVVGRDLIRASQLRAVATEAGRYTQAVSDFRDKYLALPGDFAGAVALWGASTSNGNGDGRISTPSSQQAEMFYAWQHLALAGMVDGTYSGAAGGLGSQDAAIGTNVPASQLPGAGYQITSILSGEVASQYFTGINYMHILQFGAHLTTAPGMTLAPAITTAEALSIDTKLDDGLPGSGKVMALRSDSTYSPNCTTTTSASTAAYDTTQTGNKCSLLFLLGF